jgi:hypothetical protein
MAAKRTGLMQSVLAAKDRAAAEKVAHGGTPSGNAPEPAAPAAPPPPQNPPAAAPGPAKRNRDLTDSSATTAVHIPKDHLALLRRVAVERANRDGGRPSVSNVLRDLIEANRTALEREAAAR